MRRASRRIWEYPPMTRVRRGGASSQRAGRGAFARTRAWVPRWPRSPGADAGGADEDDGLGR
eukprot:15463136-Alexandrium_andersonii.AAC.1